VHEEVSQLLSAFLDDEMTQAESQRVRIHLEDCPECRQTLREMEVLRETARTIEFPHPTQAEIDRLDQRLSVRVPRIGGWLLMILAVGIWVTYASWRFLTRPNLGLGELVAAAFVVGLVLLVISALRQRLLELPHDRYRRVRR
jgi:predicted anti-sigma-YlaC factor YlaD